MSQLPLVWRNVIVTSCVVGAVDESAGSQNDGLSHISGSNHELPFHRILSTFLQTMSYSIGMPSICMTH